MPGASCKVAVAVGAGVAAFRVGVGVRVADAGVGVVAATVCVTGTVGRVAVRTTAMVGTGTDVSVAGGSVGMGLVRTRPPTDSVAVAGALVGVAVDT